MAEFIDVMLLLTAVFVVICYALKVFKVLSD